MIITMGEGKKAYYRRSLLLRVLCRCCCGFGFVGGDGPILEFKNKKRQFRKNKRRVRKMFEYVSPPHLWIDVVLEQRRLGLFCGL